MRSRQFTSFNPVLIPWNQITLPSLPPLLPIPCPFLLAFEQALRLGKGEKNLVIFSDHTFPKQRACHRLPFCRLLPRLDKFSLSVLISKQGRILSCHCKQTARLGVFLPPPPGGNLLMVLFDQYRYLKQPKNMCDWDGF